MGPKGPLTPHCGGADGLDTTVRMGSDLAAHDQSADERIRLTAVMRQRLAAIRAASCGLFSRTETLKKAPGSEEIDDCEEPENIETNNRYKNSAVPPGESDHPTGTMLPKELRLTNFRKWNQNVTRARDPKVPIINFRPATEHLG